MNVKDGVELGDLKQIAHFFIKIQKLQLAAAAFYKPVPADEFAEACAIEITDGRQIEHQFRVALAKVFANQVAQQGAAVAKRDSAVQVDDRYAADLAGYCFQGHRQTFLAFPQRTVSVRRDELPVTAFGSAWP